MNPPKPGKYGGQDDLEKFDDWVSQLLKYFHTFKITGPAQEEDQVLYTRLFLEGLASEWYGQEILSPDRKVYFWSFEDLICGLFKRFVHEASVQNATHQYDQTKYDMCYSPYSFASCLSFLVLATDSSSVGTILL
jgi:hypothetical protein